MSKVEISKEEISTEKFSEVDINNFSLEISTSERISLEISTSEHCSLEISTSELFRSGTEPSPEARARNVAHFFQSP